MRIEDMLFRIEKIERYCENKTYETFAADDMAVDALERNFEIIGEASKLVPGYIKRAHPEVPWEALYNMRNHIVHGYDLPETLILWTTAQKRLTELKHAFERILKRRHRRH